MSLRDYILYINNILNSGTSKDVANNVDLIKDNKINQNLLKKFIKSKGKGKWLFSFASIEGNKIHLNTNYNHVLEVLEKIIQEDKIHIKGFCDAQFWTEKEKTVQEYRNIYGKGAVVKMKFEVNQIDDELSSLGIKVNGYFTRESLINFLKKMFICLSSGIFLSFDVRVSINNIQKEKILDIDISNYGTHSLITGFFDENVAMKTLNKLFFSENKQTPCYYLWYLDIVSLRGEDFKDAKRKGFLIKEYGSFENTKKEKLRIL